MTEPQSRSQIHYVNPAPFDPHRVEKMTPEMERYYMASQWRIMWWKFRRHRLAVYAGIALLIMYASILFSEVIAPYNLHKRYTDFIYAPPQPVHLFDEGSFVGPFVYGYTQKLNMETLRREYTPDPAMVQRLRFFCLGESYEFWGLVEARLQLV